MEVLCIALQLNQWPVLVRWPVANKGPLCCTVLLTVAFLLNIIVAQSDWLIVLVAMECLCLSPRPVCLVAVQLPERLSFPIAFASKLPTSLLPVGTLQKASKGDRTEWTQESCLCKSGAPPGQTPPPPLPKRPSSVFRAGGHCVTCKGTLIAE